MVRITSRHESVVSNCYELVLLAAELARERPSLLAREPDRKREAKTVRPGTSFHRPHTLIRRITGSAAFGDLMTRRGKNNDHEPVGKLGASAA
jgi:hypothetical protein